MNDVTKPNGGMPAIPGDFAAKLQAGIAESRATSRAGTGGKPYLKMQKGNGEWVYGKEDIEVQNGSRWAVNPASLKHGFICWKDGTVLGEVMSSMAEPRPPWPAPINGKAFAEQRSFELKCIDGEDAGLEVVYKNNSYGYMAMTNELLEAIAPRLTSPFPCPVVTFTSEHYPHPSYGRIYNPILPILDWCSMDGRLESGAAKAVQAPAAAEPPKAARTRRPPVEAAPPAPDALPDDAGPAPAPTRQVHSGQRRRPVAR